MKKITMYVVVYVFYSHMFSKFFHSEMAGMPEAGDVVMKKYHGPDAVSLAGTLVDLFNGEHNHETTRRLLTYGKTVRNPILRHRSTRIA